MSQTKLKVIENHTMDKENRTKSLEAAVSLIEKKLWKRFNYEIRIKNQR